MGRVFDLVPPRSVRSQPRGGPATTDSVPSLDALDEVPFHPGVVRLAPGMELALTLPAIRYRVKRAIDIVLSALAIVIMFPVLLAVALAIKMTSDGPVFFRQPRVGRHGEFFEVLKFRTMQVGSVGWLERDRDLALLYEANHFKLPATMDPRITPFGRVLRRASVDELPQLFNVFMGHMSMVGPRPVVPDELLRYEALTPAYLAVRPGITGAWQVGGRSHVGYPERAVIDFTYVMRWSLLRDLGILLRTIPAVLSRRGAY
jgi:lipopolysaccharide/colanic/teichoic acid biosynthesis glycosyltransferase